MHDEPDGAFQPLTIEAAKEIHLYWFDELFVASVGGHSVDVIYFDQMQVFMPNKALIS